LRLPPGKFLLALKPFELEVSARRAARELGLASGTVYRLFLLFQERICRAKSRWTSAALAVVFGASGGVVLWASCRCLGFWSRVEVVPDVRAETLLREAIRKVRRGSLIYTDRFGSYDGMGLGMSGLITGSA